MNKIQIVHIPTNIYSPEEVACFATRLTFRKVKSLDGALTMLNEPVSNKILYNLGMMNHGNPLRHDGHSFLIWGGSRSFLSQIRTHHVGFNVTSASQHYINFAGFLDYEVPIEVYEKCLEVVSVEPLVDYREGQLMSAESYEKYQNKWNINHSVARQITTQAARNNLIVSGNTNAWMNVFNQRLCGRNTSETLYIVHMIREFLASEYPELFSKSGPDCLVIGKCRQGHKSCKNPWPNFRDDNLKRWELLRKLDEIGLFKGCPEIEGTVKKAVIRAKKKFNYSKYRVLGEIRGRFLC